ncbi:MAG: 30S ribosomal protein S6 [Candidatus Paceibacterota bacterium]|jgi:ribosomal protein S6
MSDSKKQIYEVGFLLIPTIDEADLGKEFTTIKDVLEKQGVTFISEEMPKLRVLAYQMRKKINAVYQKYNNAYFGWIKFEGGAETQENLKKALDSNLKVLRYIIVSTVRENTMVGLKIAPKIENVGKTRKTETPAPDRPKMTEAELDKTIAELVAE